MDYLRSLSARFIWLRGVVMSLSLIGLLPQFIPFDRLEILRGVHAVIVGWNEVAAVVGEYVSIFPYVPKLSAVQVNLLAMSVGLMPSLVIYNIHAAYDSAPCETNSVDTDEISFLHRFIVISFVVSAVAITYDILILQASLSFLFPYLYTLPVSLYICTVMISKPFRDISLVVAGFMLTFEILYLLNLPEFKNSVDSFVCRHAVEACDEQ